MRLSSAFITKLAEISFPKTYLKRGNNLNLKREKLQNLASSSVFVDAGACIGEVSMNLAQQADTILMIEPDPTAAQQLNETEFIKADDRVKLLQAALAAVKGTARLYRHRKFEPGFYETVGSSSLDSTKFNVSPNHSVVVETITLSSILDQIDPNKKCVVKMDIEGAEYEVIQELLDSGGFSKVEAMFVEFHPTKIKWGRLKHTLLVIRLCLSGLIHKVNVWP